MSVFVQAHLALAATPAILAVDCSIPVLEAFKPSAR